MTSEHRSHFLRNIFAGLLLILGGAFLIGWWMIWRPLPELDGDLILPGVRQPVLVDRDGWGVPWIQASSMEDLEIAQGYVVAQDRLWQMDLLRRAAGGELAEIFGPAALDMDRENRTLGLRVAAEAAARRMDPATRKIVEAYAAGVNRYIAERSGRLPIEFTLLRYKPRPWTAADTFLISAYMWKTLTSTWKAKLNRGRITALVGPERARELFVEDSPLDHFIVGAASGKNEAPGHLVQPPRRLHQMPGRLIFPRSRPNNKMIQRRILHKKLPSPLRPNKRSNPPPIQFSLPGGSQSFPHIGRNQKSIRSSPRPRLITQQS